MLLMRAGGGEMAGRDAVSITPHHTDLDMDHTIDPSVQQHLNVSNFEVCNWNPRFIPIY